MASSLKKLFYKSSLHSGVASALNVLATVVIARWFGSEIFTDFTVDLAIIGLFLLLLELIPSNFAVFKVQDDPEWLHGVSAVQFTSAIVVVALLVLMAGLGLVFNQFSPWMLVFVVASAGKRFLDIRLQSSGRLPEYFRNEVVTATVRLGIIASAFLSGNISIDVVWGALSAAMIIAQTEWWFKNSSDWKYLHSLANKKVWISVWESRRSMYPYYATTSLKRVKDSSVPILAGIVFSSKEMLASFFLAYKGLVFVVGQVRILEAIVNHRKNLELVSALSLWQKIRIASFSQLVCLCVTAFLLYLSNIKAEYLISSLMLSVVVWPVVFYVFERAKAYSLYMADAVNVSLAAYLLSFALFSLGFNYLFAAPLISFSLAILASEIVNLMTLNSRLQTAGQGK